MQNLILYIAAVLIWGSTWYAIKFQLGVVDPALSLAYRFMLAGALMAAYGLVSGRIHETHFTLRQWGFIGLQGFLLFFFNYWFTYQATFHMTSGLVAVAFSTISIMNIFNQRLVFGIPFSRQVVIGSALGLAGIGLVFWPEISQNLLTRDEILLGMILCGIGTYSASLGNMASMRNSRDGMPILMTTAYGMIFGAILSFITALASGAPLIFDVSAPYVISLFYLALFGSVAAFLSYLTLVARIGAGKAGYVGIVVPIVALIISTFFENYAWTPQAFFGIALVLTGNVLALKKSKSAAPIQTECAAGCQV
jgi:drug/metabolite transporter (DMT)-like permease